MFTRFLAKSGLAREKPQAGQRTLFRIVRPGSGPAEWIPAAIQSLMSEAMAERVGVWLEDASASENDAPTPVFRGEVWEREMSKGPREWERLSTNAPLPVELLSGGRSFECSIDGAQAYPILGPVVDMHRVLWVPVVRRGVLRGLILMGTRWSNGSLPRRQAENVAAELGALLELEEERRLAQFRKVDLELWSRVHGWLKEKQNSGMILAQLAESCTRGAANGGVGAVFALIGERRVARERQSGSCATAEMNVRVQSGDVEWELLRPCWQQVLEKGQTCTSESGRSERGQDNPRVMAFPLRWRDETRGVMLAGLPKGRANLGSYGRLELRAQLAAEALERECPERREHDQVEESRCIPRIPEIGQSETFFQQVLEALEGGVAVFDPQGKILASNAGFPQVLGIPATGEPDLQTLEQFVNAAMPNASDPEAFRETWQQAAQMEGLELRQELEMVKPVSRKIERSVRLIRDVHGNLLGRVEVYREVAAQRAFESKMMQAEKLASLGQRATGIMHELSNPLTTILGHAQRILSRENGNSPRMEIQQIWEQAERASGILRQLLSLSRESTPERRLLSVNELVERTIHLQRSSLTGVGLQVRVDMGERLPPIEGDSGQLQQVLINLLQNAQHAIELSGIGDTFGVRTSMLDDARVRLEVWDNGPGVPVDLRKRIFDPFFTTKPAGVGTGLGLAIVLAIVREHGGRVAVDCPGAGGTRFLVDLPAARQDSAERSEPRRVVSVSGGRASGASAGFECTGRNRTPRRILVVEDEPTVANLIADVLRDEGMEVDVVGEGRSAMEAVQRCAYDLTICDLQMPGMDGATLYSKLVQSQNPACQRFLCITGDVVASRTREFLEKYRLPHVAKPFRVEELTGAVRKTLNGDHTVAAP